jgi:hypothetical protein
MHNLILSGYQGRGSWEARRLGGWEAKRPGSWEAGKQGGKKVDRVLKIFRFFAFLASRHLCFWPHSFPAFSLPSFPASWLSRFPAVIFFYYLFVKFKI